MAIDIQRLGNNQVQGNADSARQQQVARTEPTVAQQQTGKSTSTDTVMLTDTASRLRNLEKVIAEMPVVDTQRVETIRRALSEGKYNVDGDTVAASMLGFESRLEQSTESREE